MMPRARSSIHSFLVAGSIIVTPFLAGGALLVLGIGIYRLFATGPKGEPAGVPSALSVIAPAWLLLAATVLLGLLGAYSWRKRGGDKGLQQASAEPAGDDGRRQEPETRA